MLVQLMLVLFCQTILADPVKKPVYDTEDFEVIGHHFEKYVRTHNKVYDETEKIQRFINFIANVKKINELNKRYEDTLFGLNQFTDWSEEELKSLRGLRVPEGPLDGNCTVMSDPNTKDAPASFDWRQQGAVSPIKDQKNCGSCWAFSATALVESRYLQKKKKLILSEQQLVDCDTTSSGCQGGLMSSALSYLMESGGQESSADYPYTGQGACKFDKSKVQAQVLNCSDYNLSTEDALKELLFKQGPISIGIAASAWSGYQGGVFTNCADKGIDHGVLLVGYGTDKGVDFWVIKNSWGPAWGEKGYIRIQRGVKCNGIGGIGVNVSFPCVTSAIVA